MIVAVSPDVKETYHNVEALFKLLHIHEIQGVCVYYSVDLKMANIICGLQSHGCAFPCVWCRCPRDEFSSDKLRSYPVRTVGDIKTKCVEICGFKTEVSERLRELSSCTIVRSRRQRNSVQTRGSSRTPFVTACDQQNVARA